MQWPHTSSGCVKLTVNDSLIMNLTNLAILRNNRGSIHGQTHACQNAVPLYEMIQLEFLKPFLNRNSSSESVIELLRESMSKLLLLPWKSSEKKSRSEDEIDDRLGEMSGSDPLSLSESLFRSISCRSKIIFWRTSWVKIRDTLCVVLAEHST